MQKAIIGRVLKHNHNVEDEVVIRCMSRSDARAITDWDTV